MEMRHNKRSQMEVMGLTIVVILMAVAMLFVVGKMINRTPSETMQSYLDQEMAANMLNSLLKTSTGDECRGADFTELFQDCAVYYPVGNIRCEPGSIPSCKYLEDKINNTILKNTTMRWERPHRIIAWVEGKEDEPVLELMYKECSPDEIGYEFQHLETKLSPIPTDVGTLNIEFNICS